MNHCCDHSLRSASGWNELDEEARERLARLSSGRASWSTSQGPTVGSNYLSHAPRSRRAESRARPRDGGLGPPAAGCCRWWSTSAPPSSLSRSELRDADAWGRHSRPRGHLDESVHEIAAPENVAVFHGWTDRSRVYRRASPTTDPPRDSRNGYPRRSRAAFDRLLVLRGHRPVRSRLGPSIPPRRETVGARRYSKRYPLLLINLRKILEGDRLGAGSPAPVFSQPPRATRARIAE